MGTFAASYFSSVLTFTIWFAGNYRFSNEEFPGHIANISVVNFALFLSLTPLHLLIALICILLTL